MYSSCFRSLGMFAPIRYIMLNWRNKSYYFFSLSLSPTLARTLSFTFRFYIWFDSLFSFHLQMQLSHVWWMIYVCVCRENQHISTFTHVLSEIIFFSLSHTLFSAKWLFKPTEEEDEKNIYSHKIIVFLKLLPKRYIFVCLWCSSSHYIRTSVINQNWIFKRYFHPSLVLSLSFSLLLAFRRLAFSNGKHTENCFQSNQHVHVVAAAVATTEKYRRDAETKHKVCIYWDVCLAMENKDIINCNMQNT